MKYDNQEPFPPRISNELLEYIETVEQKNSTEFFENTFNKVGLNIIHNFDTIYEFEFEPLYEEDASTLEYAGETVPRDMLLSYVRGLTENRVVRIMVPYVVAAPILFVVYQQNEQAAQILALVIVAFVQTYYTPHGKE